jgi:5-methylcytosine-specific restriction endonuclease McrA
MICGKLIEKSYNPTGGIYYKKTCSDGCRSKSFAHMKGKPSVSKLKEDEVRDRFNNKYKTFEYVSGYTGCESKLTVRCLVCNQTMECGAQVLRKKWDANCTTCEQTKKDIVQEAIEKAKRIKEEEISKSREIKRLELEEKLKGIEVACEQCGEVFIAFNNRRKFCSSICLRRNNNSKRDKRNRDRYRSNGNVEWSITLDKLIKRDKGMCHICGKQVDSNDYVRREDNAFITGNNYPSIDHVKPISKGGTHQWSNIRLAHRYCNSIKRDSDMYVNSDGQYCLSV